MDDLVVRKDCYGLERKNYEKVIERLPEYVRASTVCGNSTSQSSYSLQTMSMISDSPYSRLKQCLAQIDKRYQALRESHFKIEKMKSENIDLTGKKDRWSEIQLNENLSLITEIEKKNAQAFRRMGMFQDMYDSIMKTNNIPENWTEKDFESDQILHMIKSSFRCAIQDLTANGRVSRAAVEYWEQLGIHPQYAETITKGYLINIDKLISEGNKISITMMYDFLDEMVEEFKDSHKEALKRIGLDEIGSEGFMAEGATKPQ